MGRKKSGSTPKEGAPKRRMSKKAELALHNGESIKETPVLVDAELPKPNEGEVMEGEGVPEITSESETIVEQEQTTVPQIELPVIVEDTKEEAKLVIMQEPVKFDRKVFIRVSVDQKGILDKDGVLVDPNGNTFKTIEVTAEGKIFDIAKIAGRVANDLHDFYMSLQGTSIKRGAGFNVNLHIEDNKASAESKINVKSISKVRMSNPVDIAFKVGTAILTQVEGDNSDGLLTGDFKVSEEGELFMKKLKFSEKTLNLPLYEVKKQINEKRLAIKTKIKSNKDLIANN